MRYHLHLLLASLLFAACVHTDYVPLADGTVGVALDCPRWDACMDAASDACPHGYEILNQGTRYAGSVTNAYGGQYSAVAYSQPVYRAQMLIRCKARAQNSGGGS